jgi:hypothetical protein
MAAVTFKLLMSSIGGARNAVGAMSGLGLAEKFSTVCARCISGRRCTTSVTATDAGSGGRGAFGGGTEGGLRSARRGLKRVVDRTPNIVLGRPKKRNQRRVPAYRIVPPVLPLRERPPAALLGADT